MRVLPEFNFGGELMLGRVFSELVTNPKLSAVCGAIFTGLLAPLILKWVDRYIESKGFASVSSDHRKNVSGVWLGKGNDNYVTGEKPFYPFILKLDISFKGKNVKAKGRLEPDGGDLPNVDLDMSGGFYDSDLIQLTYQSSNRARKQLGAIVLRLSAEGEQMDGYYAGFSPTRDAFVTGTVCLRKLISRTERMGSQRTL
jgi:hypothetical protein